MSQRPPLAAFAVLAAAAVLPAHALIPMAADVVQGILDGQRKTAAQDFASPGIRPDPDPLDKYKGLSIKPTAEDLSAHEAWVRRQAAQSEAADTLLEKLGDARAAGAMASAQRGKSNSAKLPQGQFYAFAANGSAQLYTTGATPIRTSASGLKALYQTLSEDDRRLAAQAGATGSQTSQEDDPEGAPSAGGAAKAAFSVSPSPTSTSGAASAASAAAAILPAFAPLTGEAAAKPSDEGSPDLPASAVASGGAASGTTARRAVGAKTPTRRLEGFGKGNAGGPGASALSREGDMPTVKVGGMEELFNGGAGALNQNKKSP